MVTMSQNVLTTSAEPVRKPAGAQTPADALGVTKRMSTLDAGGQESCECPTCTRSFSTEYGMKQHHAKTHNESLSTLSIECDQCGVVFERRVQKVETNDHNFCSNECRGNWLSNQTGEDHPLWSGRVNVECEQCGTVFETYPYKSDTARFCSSDCHDLWRSKNKTGDSNPNYRAVSCECEGCGEEYELPPSLASRNRHCSMECYIESFPGDYSGQLYYGSSWDCRRKQALERDGYKCVVCGVGEDELGQLPDVHHIRPFREFGPENHSEANQLDNLVTLCRKHHREWEGVPLRPEPID